MGLLYHVSPFFISPSSSLFLSPSRLLLFAFYSWSALSRTFFIFLHLSSLVCHLPSFHLFFFSVFCFSWIGSPPVRIPQSIQPFCSSKLAFYRLPSQFAFPCFQFPLSLSVGSSSHLDSPFSSDLLHFYFFVLSSSPIPLKAQMEATFIKISNNLFHLSLCS